MTKGDTYKKVKAYINKFAEQNGSYLCRDLKGVETGKILLCLPGLHPRWETRDRRISGITEREIIISITNRKSCHSREEYLLRGRIF